MKTAQKRLVDAHRVAAVLDVSAHRVRSLFRDGRIPGYVVGDRNDIRFDVDEVLARLRSDAEAASHVEGAQG